MTILAGVWRIAQEWARVEEEAPVRLETMDSWTGMLWWRASDYGHISKTEPTKFAEGFRV